MRDVLGRVSAGAAGKILDSANPREIRTQQKAVSVAAKARGSTSSSGEIEGTCMSKNLEETVPVRLQSEIRREWIREERLQGIAEGASSAPVWPAHQPRRSPGKTSVWEPIVA